VLFLFTDDQRADTIAQVLGQGGTVEQESLFSQNSDTSIWSRRFAFDGLGAYVVLG
jgi:hypothetical protein